MAAHSRMATTPRAEAPAVVRVRLQQARVVISVVHALARYKGHYGWYKPRPQATQHALRACCASVPKQ
jgi:hypothetical protein